MAAMTHRERVLCALNHQEPDRVPKKYRWPDPRDPGRTRGMAEAARRLHQETDYAVIVSMPSGIVHQAQFLRGFEGWFTDLVADPTFFTALMEKLADLWIEMAKDEFDAVGENVDICFYGDDADRRSGAGRRLHPVRGAQYPA